MKQFKHRLRLQLLLQVNIFSLRFVSFFEISAFLDGSTTLSSSSTAFSPDQIVLSSTVPASNGAASSIAPAVVTSSNGGNSDDDSTNVNPLGTCSRSSAAREYAFVDCSEVYLAGKRTTGIYEIW